MLLQLAQREIDLLLRGTKPKNLKGLRSRIQELFWQFVKEPTFNPEMYSLASVSMRNFSFFFFFSSSVI